MKRIGARILLALTLLGGAAGAAVLRVDPASTALHPDGKSWDRAFPSLPQALKAAIPETEIWVRAGVYKPGGSGSFTLPHGIALYGGFRGREDARDERNPQANRTVLSGDIGATGRIDDNSQHVLALAGDGLIDGFVITSGHNDVGGAAVRIGKQTKRFTATDCTFEKHRARQGGAIQADHGHLELSRCIFFNNAAEQGGAIHLSGNASLQATACHFSANHAQQLGGGVYLGDSVEASFNQCRFLFNRSEENGGALAAEGRPTLTLTNCDLSENSAATSGAALHADGLFSPQLDNCQIHLNQSGSGATVTGRNGAGPVLDHSTFANNQNATGYSDLDLAALPAPLAKAEPNPAPAAPPPKKNERLLPDATVHHPAKKRIALRTLTAENPFTVIALGDPTDPEFLAVYRELEAAAFDYASQGVVFHYLLSYLRHPENHGYLQAVTLADRLALQVETQRILNTRILWLCDDLDHRAAMALQHDRHRLIIVDRAGHEKFAGTLADIEPLRKTLTQLTGTVTHPTKANSYAAPALPPVEIPETRHIERVKTALSDRFTALQCTPMESPLPHPIKVRVEADHNLLETGNGRLYLGLHVDPLHSFDWNNLTTPASYTLRGTSGTLVAPAHHLAPRVTRSASDAEPREFMIEIRNWNPENPLALTVDLPLLSTKTRQPGRLTHRYLIALRADPFGGTTFGRQVAVPRRATDRKPRRPR